MVGITYIGSQIALNTLLPYNGANQYVGLLTKLPTDNQTTGLVEAVGSGYTRILFNQWFTGFDGVDTWKYPNGLITFPPLTAPLLGIVGWAIWQAASGATPPMIVGATTPTDFAAGDQPFLSNTLTVRIQPKL